MKSKKLYMYRMQKVSEQIRAQHQSYQKLLSPARYFLPFVERFPSSRYIVPSVSTLPVHLILPFFRFNASIPFKYSFLRFKPFMWLRPSTRVNFYTILSLTRLFYCNVYFLCYFLLLASTLPQLVTFFLSFQLLPSVCYQAVHFAMSVLTFHPF